MRTYEVKYHKKALDFLESLDDKKLKKKLKDRVDSLISDPIKKGDGRVKGAKEDGHDVFKVRQGQYRVLYAVVMGEIWVLEIGHRREVYRKR